MKLSGLPEQPLTIVGGDGRSGAPITYALAAGWITEAFAAKKRAAVIAPDQEQLTYWLSLTRGTQPRSRFDETVAKLAPDLNAYQRSAADVAGRFGTPLRRHKPELVIVIDHHDPDPASWAWLSKVQSVTQAIVMTPTATDSGVRVFADDPDTVKMPKLIAGLVANDDGVANEFDVAGYDWEPDEANAAFDSDIPNAGKWNWTKSKRSAEGMAAEWLALAEESRIEAEQIEARAYLARFGFAPTLAEMPKALRQAAPWLATSNTGDK